MTASPSFQPIGVTQSMYAEAYSPGMQGRIGTVVICLNCVSNQIIPKNFVLTPQDITFGMKKDENIKMLKDPHTG